MALTLRKTVDRFETSRLLEIYLEKQRFWFSRSQGQRVGYLILEDRLTGINRGTNDHRFVSIESQLDVHSPLFTRSTDSEPAVDAPGRLFSPQHFGHACAVLTKDAWVYFVAARRFRLTASVLPVTADGRKMKSWQEKIKEISFKNRICIEPDDDVAAQIVISNSVVQ